MAKKWNQNEDHYCCNDCEIYFPLAPKGKCPNGHDNIRAVGWEMVIEPLRELWLNRKFYKNKNRGNYEN